MEISLLIIEDHPAMIEGYKSILAYSDYNFVVTSASNCKEAYDLIVTKGLRFDLIFLDLILPGPSLQDLHDGEDLAELIRKALPKTKLVVLTSHTEALVLYSIIKKSSPNGVLVKSDFSADELIKAVDLICRGGNYRSATVKRCLSDLLNRNTYLDSYNRQIIQLLAKGVKTKNLSQHLNLSISAIDKRKVQIKDYFNIEKGNDEDILREARSCGFI